MILHKDLNPFCYSPIHIISLFILPLSRIINTIWVIFSLLLFQVINLFHLFYVSCVGKQTIYTPWRRTWRLLQKEMQDLYAMRDGLLRRVSKEENRGIQGLMEVKEWFSRVEATETEVNCLLDDSIFEIYRLSMYGYCSQIPATTYSCGGRG